MISPLIVTSPRDMGGEHEELLEPTARNSCSPGLGSLYVGRMALDYAQHLRSESDRFLDVLRETDPAAPVPSCPGWTAADLLWHLTEVQAFWSEIVRRRAQSPDDVPKPERPASPSDLVETFARWSRLLEQALEDADDTITVWTWSADHSVGFIRRRQAHEALIHRLDAELPAGRSHRCRRRWPPTACSRRSMSCTGAAHPGGPSPRPVRRSVCSAPTPATDSGWLLGRFTGTDPDDGTKYDEPDIAVGTAAGHPDARVSGTAGDLDAWIWHRGGTDQLVFEGSEPALRTLLTRSSGIRSPSRRAVSVARWTRDPGGAHEEVLPPLGRPEMSAKDGSSAGGRGGVRRRGRRRPRGPGPASPSVRVRSGARKRRAKASDFLPSPICAPVKTSKRRIDSRSSPAPSRSVASTTADGRAASTTRATSSFATGKDEKLGARRTRRPAASGSRGRAPPRCYARGSPNSAHTLGCSSPA